MKVCLPLGLIVCLVIALLLARPLAAPAEGPTPAPVPPVDLRGETVLGNVIVPSAPAPVPPVVEEKKTAESRPTQAREHPGGPRFMGAMTCSSSLCHGGGSPERDAYTIWKKSDPHQRAAATLAGTRAARIAQGVALGNAAAGTRCTECHTPLAVVPEERLPAGLDVRTEGVSCESCHGPAQNWIRSHTRRDFTHAQNVETGVREVKNLYARANSCVACHQVIDADILAAGHPPLLFELDAQTVAEPRHWIDPGDYFGPQAWLTGQAVALREMSWSLGQTTGTVVPEAREQWRALLWLLQRTTEARGEKGEGGALPGFDAVPNADQFSPGNVTRARATADDFARAASHLEWTPGSVRRCLDGLAATDKEFTPVAGGEGELALRSRAQRLALALSRLLAPLQKQDTAKWTPASQELDKLFAVADARAIFDGGAFAEQLRRFHGEVAKMTAD